MRTRIPQGHSLYTIDAPVPVRRTASVWFAPPVPVGQREPGTNYITIITTPDVTTWEGRRPPQKRTG